MANCPTFLTQFNLDWKRTYNDNVYRSQPERGPAKSRLKNTNPVEELSGTLNLSYSEFEELLDFYENDIKQGSLVFPFNDFIKGPKRARITEFSYNNNEGNGMQVSLKLEIF